MIRRAVRGAEARHELQRRKTFDRSLGFGRFVHHPLKQISGRGDALAVGAGRWLPTALNFRRQEFPSYAMVPVNAANVGIEQRRDGSQKRRHDFQIPHADEDARGEVDGRMKPFFVAAQPISNEDPGIHASDDTLNGWIQDDRRPFFIGISMCWEVKSERSGGSRPLDLGSSWLTANLHSPTSGSTRSPTCCPRRVRSIVHVAGVKRLMSKVV